MAKLRKKLSDLFAAAGFSQLGIADINGLHPVAGIFPRALSVGLAYGIPFAVYEEPAYLAHTVRVREEFDRKFADLRTLFAENGIKHAVPGEPPYDPASGKRIWKRSAANMPVVTACWSARSGQVKRTISRLDTEDNKGSLACRNSCEFR